MHSTNFGRVSNIRRGNINMVKNLCIIFALSLVACSTLVAQGITRTWTGALDNSFLNTLNWEPNGPPGPNDTIIIPQSNRDPVFLGPTPATVYSISLNDTFLVLVDAPSTVDNFLIQPSGRLLIHSPGAAMSIGGKLNIDNGGLVHISSQINVTSIGNDVSLNGSLSIDTGAVVSVTCMGNWLRGSNSSFNAGNSTFIFANPLRSLVIQRGTFHNLIIGTALADTFEGKITVNNKLVLANPVAMHNGDTLTIANTDTLALFDSTDTGIITHGVVRRAIDSSLTGRYRFHNNHVSVKFYEAGTRPSIVGIAEFPDSNINQGGHDVKRFYDIGRTGGSDFAAELTLSYLQSEVPDSVDESKLQLFRSTNDGLSWDSVGGRVDTVKNFVRVDTVTGFSPWKLGQPTAPLSVQRTNISTFQQFELFQNYPNPFNPSTEIRFSVPAKSKIQLEVYNVAGQRVAALLSQILEPGTYATSWNGVNLHGQEVPSGLYFSQLTAVPVKPDEPLFRQVRKMLLLK